MFICVASLASPLVLENNSGSARTDYLSNHNLSYRARHRRQLLKEKTSSAATSPQVPDQGEIYMSGFHWSCCFKKWKGENLNILKIYRSFYFVLSENSDEGLLNQASSAFMISSSEAATLSGSMDNGTFNSADSLSSRGITFRDPETGVMYIQTQLLQVHFFFYKVHCYLNSSSYNKLQFCGFFGQFCKIGMLEGRGLFFISQNKDARLLFCNLTLYYFIFFYQIAKKRLWCTSMVTLHEQMYQSLTT